MVVKLCPRDSTQLAIDYGYPNCVTCGYEDYGPIAADRLPPATRREGAKLPELTKPRHWAGSLQIWRKTHWVGVSYRLEGGAAAVEQVHNWPLGDIGAKVTRIRRLFHQDTGYHLQGLTAWVRENAA